jgi:hypothetical protein
MDSTKQKICDTGKCGDKCERPGETAWKECADRLVNSSGWHDMWPQAVAHYRKLKAKEECSTSIKEHIAMYNEIVGGS